MRFRVPNFILKKGYNYEIAKKLLCVSVILLFVVINCDDGEALIVDEPPQTINSLIGTRWKLEGIVDTETGVMRILEPRNCEICYTLHFATDSIFFSHSSTNNMGGFYTADYEVGAFC